MICLLEKGCGGGGGVDCLGREVIWGIAARKCWLCNLKVKYGLVELE